ncbi:hypothetical protein [Flavobacterium sp.]|uniref:hypothetical protein n=1 Tax=Flavobacterium sp. TaxID=239 RepID=UPI001212D968|nr:hypothetical protein [Flavobacterium sp.]RZJ72307.1 MAG: hypothetical protein EOO49_07605 [Flavobacterium sp.]
MSEKPKTGFLKGFLWVYSVLFFSFAIFQFGNLSKSTSNEQQFWIFLIAVFAWLIHVGAYLPIAIYDIAWKTFSKIEFVLFHVGCGLIFRLYLNLIG